MPLLSYITGFWAGLLLVLGILGLSKRWGSSIRGVLSAIPIGSPTIWAIVLIVLGFTAGGLSYITSGATSLFQTASTATLVTTTAPVVTASLVNCRANVPTNIVSTAGNGNFSFRADPYDVSHYYIDLTNGSVIPAGARINGTITCQRTGNIDNAVAFPCNYKFQTYVNKQSSTDTGIYRMVSQVSGDSLIDMPEGFKAEAYLNDGSVATTSSDAEKTTWVFTGGSSAQASDSLGYDFELPTSTNIAYLNAQDSINNEIICNGQTVGKLTVTQLTR